MTRLSQHMFDQKKQCDTLINQVNQKSTVISDLSAKLQEQGLVITALKNDLRKLKGKALVENAVTKHTINPNILKINVQPLAPILLNNRTSHSDYLKHTQEQAAILKKIEFLIIIRQTCPSINNPNDKLVVVTPKNKDKRVIFTEPVTFLGTIKTKTDSSSNLVSNKTALSSTGVKPSTSASGSQPSCNTKKDKIQQPPNSTQKNKVEANPRKVKYSLKNKKSVKISKRKVWKPIGKVFTNIGYTWRPIGRTITIVGNECPLTRITTTTEVPPRKPIALEIDTPKPVVTLVYSRKHMKPKTTDLVGKTKKNKSISANKKEPSKSWGSTVSDDPSSSLTNCRNNQVEKIMGYGDYYIRNVMISRVCYVEGLGHNLFSIGQLCDLNLKVAFRLYTYFIRNLEGDDLLIGPRGNNLYTLSIGDMMACSLICILSKASKTKSWLWHQRMSHLNFGVINHLARNCLVLKFEKDHMCSADAMGKSQKKPHKPKFEDTNQEKLNLLHMDLCGPMRVDPF
ncbi:retrovirus-related pol polyprotein from transposon TNT 1-94 [Tanacetum coccineum]